MDLPTLPALFDKITNHAFGTVEARTLLNYSCYVARQHPDAHIAYRKSELDFLLFARRDGNDYRDRAYHSMFLSAEEAVQAIAAGLNTRAGAALIRLFGIRGVERATLLSRSAVTGAQTMLERHSISSQGATMGVMYGELASIFVTMAFRRYEQCLALITAYPAKGAYQFGSPHHEPYQRTILPPPMGHDWLVFEDRGYLYPAGN
jgi:hypothetical protein